MEANTLMLYHYPSVIVFISRWIINGPQVLHILDHKYDNDDELNHASISV